MNRTIYIFFFILFCCTLLHAQNRKQFTHTVDKGQTLYSISRMYEVNVDEIVKLNPGSREKLSISQTLIIPQPVVSEQKTISTGGNPQLSHNSKPALYHTIQGGETLYKLGQMYKIIPQDIINANPGLTAANFKIGEVVLIPTVAPQITKETQAIVVTNNEKIKIRTTHRVEKGETIYSLSRKYEITTEELIAANPELKEKKLKRKMELKIPFSTTETTREIEETAKATEIPNAELFKQIEEEVKNSNIDINCVKAAIILPFYGVGISSSEQSRMIEYYEGFLMAVEFLKRMGYSFDIHVFNSGSENSSTLSTLINSGQMDDMHILFGSLYPSHSKQLAKYAKSKNIPLVIPFTSKEDEIFSNPMVYVVNTMQSYFYSQVTDHFEKRFSKANIIIIEQSHQKDKNEFIAHLKSNLKSKNFSFTTLSEELFTGSTPNIVKITTAMTNDRPNLFIPTSSSEAGLSNILGAMVMMRNDSTNQIPQFNLFGYPEWQIYARNHQKRMYEVDTYFYTSFFTNNTLPEPVRFQNNFARWYNRNLQLIYPRYGMLGYDTGYYFLLAISKYGTEIDNNINKVSFTPIQTGFKFERVNNWGGFINKKIYFVRYSPDYQLHKIDFDQ